MRAGRRAGPPGFILPTTILVITLVTVMLAAAFVMVSAEYRISDNAFASSRSLAIAQAGMQNYLSVGHIFTGTSDTARYTFGGGYARVQALRLRDSTTTAPKTAPMWVVRAIGYDTVRATSGQPNGQRGIAQFALLQSGSLPARAAMTAANGVQMVANGGNPLNGHNFGVLTTGCVIPARPDTMGVAVPGGGFGGTGSADAGNGTEYLASANAVIDSTRIDWSALLGGQFTPDFVNQLPAAGNNTYQAHYYTSSMTIPTGQRRGLLVVDGNVTLASGAHWDGIIVAGGFVDGGGNFTWTVHGMVISGLSISQGQNVQASQLRRGGSRVLQWDYCYATSSIASLSYLVPVKNAWVDNWSLY